MTASSFGHGHFWTTLIPASAPRHRAPGCRLRLQILVLDPALSGSIQPGTGSQSPSAALLSLGGPALLRRPRSPSATPLSLGGPGQGGPRSPKVFPIIPGPPAPGSPSRPWLLPDAMSLGHGQPPTPGASSRPREHRPSPAPLPLSRLHPATDNFVPTLLRIQPLDPSHPLAPSRPSNFVPTDSMAAPEVAGHGSGWSSLAATKSMAPCSRLCPSGNQFSASPRLSPNSRFCPDLLRVQRPSRGLLF